MLDVGDTIEISGFTAQSMHSLACEAPRVMCFLWEAFTIEITEGAANPPDPESSTMSSS